MANTAQGMIKIQSRGMIPHLDKEKSNVDAIQSDKKHLKAKKEDSNEQN